MPPSPIIHHLMKTVTFAIPCYNVEKCVSKCLDSILSAHMHDDIEILAINDGSKDGTAALLHAYERKHPDVIRVIDKQNGGWGTVVNMAIQEAQGKYFKEIDADDWVDTENIPHYIQKLKEEDVDYVANSFREINIHTGDTKRCTFNEQLCNKVHDIRLFWEQTPDSWGFPIHCITYSTQFIRDIKLTVGPRYYTDFEYFLKSMPYVKTLYMTNIDVTVYARGNDEQSTGAKGYAKHYHDMAELVLRLAQFYDELPAHTLPQIREAIHRTIAGACSLAYEVMMSPIYAGKDPFVLSNLQEFDHALTQYPTFYNDSGQTKKRGIRYIRLWRNTGFNILTLRKYKTQQK